MEILLEITEEKKKELDKDGLAKIKVKNNLCLFCIAVLLILTFFFPIHLV